MGDSREPGAVSARSAERMKFFTDALVAIAMTLLILSDFPPGQGDLTAATVLTVLFGVALVLALVVPGAGYYPMSVLFLTGPLQALLSRGLTSRQARRAGG